MMRYIDIKKGMEVDFKINTSGKAKRTRTEEDPFAPVSRTQGTGIVIGAYPHIIVIQMADGQKITIERVALMHMKTAAIRPARKSLPMASLFEPDPVP